MSRVKFSNKRIVSFKVFYGPKKRSERKVAVFMIYNCDNKEQVAEARKKALAFAKEVIKESEEKIYVSVFKIETETNTRKQRIN